MLQHFIREATIEDSPQLMPLLEQLGYPMTLAEMQARLEIYTKRSDYNIFVSLDNQKITGFIAVSIREMMVYTSKKMIIEGLVIDDKYQRQGIAQQLMQKAEQYARQQGCTIIALTSGKRRASSGTHEFYHKLGYKNEGNMAKVYLRKDL